MPGQVSCHITTVEIFSLIAVQKRYLCCFLRQSVLIPGFDTSLSPKNELVSIWGQAVSKTTVFDLRKRHYMCTSSTLSERSYRCTASVQIIFTVIFVILLLVNVIMDTSTRVDPWIFTTTLIPLGVSCLASCLILTRCGDLKALLKLQLLGLKVFLQ